MKKNKVSRIFLKKKKKSSKFSRFFLSISDGHAILGCSNLTGRFWIGSLWYYRNPSDAPSVEKSLTGVDFDNGLVEGFFLDNKTIIVALDNGGVETVKLSFR